MHTDDLISRLLQQTAVAEKPLRHPSLPDVPDSLVRERVQSMLAQRLVTGELYTAFNGRWIVLNPVCGSRGWVVSTCRSI